MKRALVTGGSGGIGSAICRRLAADGLFVYIHANRNLAKVDALVDEIHQSGGMAESIAFDVTDTVASRVILEALADDAPIQVLVNNAGVHDDAVFHTMSATQWFRVLDVSLNGFFNVTQPLLLPMIRSRWGVSSISPRSQVSRVITGKSTMWLLKAHFMPRPNRSLWNLPVAVSRQMRWRRASSPLT